jgi:hypothetical protein
VISVTPDQLHALAGHITREYGSYGYRIVDLENTSWSRTAATVRHADGSEFRLEVDREENVRLVPEEVAA